MRLTQALPWIAWNIFLALLPVGFAYAAAALVRRWNRRNRVFLALPVFLLGLAWFTFLPNSCYLLTEWRHFLEVLGYHNLHNTWEQDGGDRLILMGLTLFYVFYSGVGVFAFALAIRPIARIMRERGATLWVWAIPFFLLMSLGVYLGLRLRFNTWDLLNEFGAVWTSITALASRPSLTAFIILFAAFLWVAYLSMDIWIDGLLYRLHGKRSPLRNPGSQEGV